MSDPKENALIVLDASNIAISNSCQFPKDKYFSTKGLIIAIEFF